MTDGMAQPNHESGQSSKRQELQESILEAARRVLERHDPTELTLDGVATEADLPMETVETCFRDTNDLVLSLAAQELTRVASAMYADRNDERPWAASSSGALSLLHWAAEIIDAPQASPASPITSDTVLGAQSHAPWGADSPDQSVAVDDDSVSKLDQGLKELEKLQGDIAAELQDGRMRLLEALPPPPPFEHETIEAPPLPHDPDATMQLPAFDPAMLVPKSSADTEAKPENLLAAARRAAIEAAVQKAKADDGGRARVLRPITKGSKKNPLLLGVTGLLIIGGVFVIGYRVAFDYGVRDGAEQVATQAATAQATENPTPPVGTIVATPTEPDLAPMERLVELASTGNSKAELLLGLRYLEGDGVPHDEAEAFHWFQESAQDGEAVAQYWLANLYGRTTNANADPAQSMRWYGEAARQGNRMAMNNLAVAHAEGIGTEKNMGEAAHWFGEAAAHGYIVAQFNLAVLYERGDGVPQDLTEAYKWYAVAAAQGDNAAKERVAALDMELTPDQLNRARQAALTFSPTPLNRAANFAPELSEL
jgi:TPR repeat protein